MKRLLLFLLPLLTSSYSSYYSDSNYRYSYYSDVFQEEFYCSNYYETQSNFWAPKPCSYYQYSDPDDKRRPENEWMYYSSGEYYYESNSYVNPPPKNEWYNYQSSWYESDIDYNKKNITQQDQEKKIGQVAFFLDDCPPGWKVQHLMQETEDMFEQYESNTMCRGFDRHYGGYTNQRNTQRMYRNESANRGYRVEYMDYKDGCMTFKQRTQRFQLTYNQTFYNQQPTNYNSRLVACVKAKGDKESTLIYENKLEVTNIQNDITNIVGGFTAGVVILYILVGLIFVALIRLFTKKQKTQVMPATNNVQLDEEYLALTKRDNAKILEDNAKNMQDQDQINKEVQESLQQCKQLLQNGNLRDKNQQLEIETLQEELKGVKQQNEAIRVYQEEVIQQKQEEIEMREIELIEKQEAIQLKQDLIEDQIEEIQELQDQLQEKMMQEEKKEVEPPLEEMTEEDLQIKLIKKRKEKKDRGQRFIGDLKQKIYDAINKQKIFHNKEKEIVRVNAFTELYGQFNSSFNNLNVDGQPKVQKAMEEFCKGMQQVDDKRIQKIEAGKGKDGQVNYKALIKKYILAIESRAKDYFDLLKRLSQRYDMALVMQTRQQTAFLLSVQDIFMRFNDVMNILSNNDLFNNVNVWFDDLIALVDAYTRDIEHLDGEIGVLEAQLKKVKAAGTSIK